MTQNIIIAVIIFACAWYIARRVYNNFRNSQTGCGCGSSCSDCGPDISSTCKPTSTDSDSK